MYAIIAAGGRQYRVSQGDVIYIDKVNQEADSAISFDVLMRARRVPAGSSAIVSRTPRWKSPPSTRNDFRGTVSGERRV